MPGCAWALVSEDRPAALTEAASPPTTAAPLRHSRRPSSVVAMVVLLSRTVKMLHAAQKGPDARRRPTAAREAYSLYVERAAEGANEAEAPVSPGGKASAIAATRPPLMPRSASKRPVAVI